jgi:very-short-patch-repair endonuclease
MTIERARQLRKSMSPAEAKMWTVLRQDPFKSFHFRRQMQIGPYYADFASFKAKLVIEIDGSQHYEDAAISYDERRTLVIEAEGYQVVRFATTNVMYHMNGVSIALLAALGLQS